MKVIGLMVNLLIIKINIKYYIKIKIIKLKNLKIIYLMEKVLNIIQMVIYYMKVILLMVNLMVMENIIMMMEIILLDNGKMA